MVRRGIQLEYSVLFCIIKPFLHLFTSHMFPRPPTAEDVPARHGDGPAPAAVRGAGSTGRGAVLAAGPASQGRAEPENEPWRLKQLSEVTVTL